MDQLCEAQFNSTKPDQSTGSETNSISVCVLSVTTPFLFSDSIRNGDFVVGTFKIISWNVETFGETKADMAIPFIAAIAMKNDADLLLFMETTEYGQWYVAHRLYEALGGGAEHFRPKPDTATASWAILTSEQTGKYPDFPGEIIYSKYISEADDPSIDEVDRLDYDIDIYATALAPCYDHDAANEKFTFNLQNYNQITDEAKNDVLEALVIAGWVRFDKETYTGLFRYNVVTSSSGDHGIYNSMSGDMALPAIGGANLESCGWASNGTGGLELAEIGYSDPDSEINGRTPIRYGFARRDRTSGALTPTSILQFHAPFGRSVTTRYLANRNLLNVAFSSSVDYAHNFDDNVPAIIAGDFNVDVKSPSGYDKGYKCFTDNGYELHINAATSLKRKVKDSETDSEKFRANGYDNIMLKGFDDCSGGGEVIDCIKEIYEYYNAQSRSSHYLSAANLPDRQLPFTMHDAFKYYREKISDHLPILLTIQFPD